MNELGGTVIIVGTLFGFLVIIAWIILPFAILGTKPLLRQILAEQKQTREMLERRIPYPPKP